MPDQNELTANLTSPISDLPGAVWNALYPKGFANADEPGGGLFGSDSILGRMKRGDPTLATDIGMAFAAPIEGYHGTPHTFTPVEGNPFGKFSNDAIGTGEGNQSFGWGHYIAGNPNVAEQYMKGGNLLRITAKPDEHELLDWDKPLSEQPDILSKIEKLPESFHEALGEHLENRGYNHPLDAPEDYTGGKFIKSGSHYNVVDAPEILSQMLHEAGIPGIKYADQGSRNAFLVKQHLDQNGDWTGNFNVTDRNGNVISTHGSKYAAMQAAKDSGTKNYVIFDPSNLTITGRNGEMLEPVDHDPFKAITPVDHNPFESGENQ